MTERAVFCSYARHDAEAVGTIADELDRLGQRAWLDEKLSGGQSWWDTILDHVRSCDCFLFALSDSSLRSKACMAELDYAHRLRRTILPVAVGPVIDQLLPPYLAETQRVDAGDTHQLARALLSLPDRPPLPEPLPTPPRVPISYLDGLASQIGREELTTAEQRNLEGELKHRVGDPDEREAALTLLRRLRRHPSINAWVAAEIDADLAQVEAASGEVEAAEAAGAAEPSAPPPSPAPGSQAAPSSPEPPAPATPTAGRAGAPGGHRPDSRRVVVPPPEPEPEQAAAPVGEHGGPPPARPAQTPPYRRPREDGRADRRRRGSGGLIAVLVLLVVLAVAGGVAWAVTSGGDDAPPADPVPTDPGGGDGGGEPDTTEPTETTDTVDPDTGTDTGGETGTGEGEGGAGEIED